MLTLIVFILILSILIVVHEFGHLIAAKRVGVRVEKFSLGFGPQLFKTKKGGTEYAVSAVPLGGFVKLAGDNLEEFTGKPYEYYSKKPGERFQIIFAGPFLNYVLGFLLFWIVFFVGYPTLTTKIGYVFDGQGAQQAGIKVGDKVIAINDKRVDYWVDMVKAVQENKSIGKARFTILRDNKELSLNIAIKENTIPGIKESTGSIGIGSANDIILVRHGFLNSCYLALNETKNLTVITYVGLWRMITGKLSIRESVTGPIGIFEFLRRILRVGLNAVLHFTAILSISLGIFNLLPLPVMDGGHIFLLGVEKLRRKGLSVKTENIVTRIGVSIIVALAVFVTYNDIVRLFGDKIHKFFK